MGFFPHTFGIVNIIIKRYVGNHKFLYNLLNVQSVHMKTFRSKNSRNVSPDIIRKKLKYFQEGRPILQ